MSRFFRFHSVFSLVSNSLYDLPAPSSLSYLWNFGSLLSFCLLSQFLTGLFLSFHYTSMVDFSFYSVIHIARDIGVGSYFRFFHMNGASFFFILIFIHIGRGIYMGSYKYVFVWFSGIMILFCLMGTAFLGYVLPWGQMSFWGATVITNLMSAVPYVGSFLVEWIWGGFSVSGVTLARFFSLHFLLPFVLIMLLFVHLIFLHLLGSSSSLHISSDIDKVSFGPYFIFKDLFGLFFFLLFFCFFSFSLSYDMGDPENFNVANPLSTPVHIQPEWYFLFAYAVLRSIPSSLGGVLALVFSIVVFLFHSFLSSEFIGLSFFFLKKLFYWFFVSMFFLLTWLGAKPVEPPYDIFSQVVGFFYFFFAFLFVL